MNWLVYSKKKIHHFKGCPKWTSRPKKESSIREWLICNGFRCWISEKDEMLERGTLLCCRYWIRYLPSKITIPLICVNYTELFPHLSETKQKNSSLIKCLIRLVTCKNCKWNRLHLYTIDANKPFPFEYPENSTSAVIFFIFILQPFQSHIQNSQSHPKCFLQTDNSQQVR